MIIAICGQAGSGKDSVADVLVARHGYFRVALAAPLKRFCAEMFGWDLGPDGPLNGPSHERNRPDPRWGGLTPRHALQTLGTEWGRAMHPDVWVDYLLCATTYSGQGRDNFVVTDVRFENEAKILKAHGARIVRVVRAGQPQLTGAAGAHPSEAGIPDELVDLRVINDSTLDVLQARAAHVPSQLGLYGVNL